MLNSLLVASSKVPCTVGMGPCYCCVVPEMRQELSFVAHSSFWLSWCLCCVWECAQLLLQFCWGALMFQPLAWELWVEFRLIKNFPQMDLCKLLRKMQRGMQLPCRLQGWSAHVHSWCCLVKTESSGFECCGSPRMTVGVCARGLG